MKLAILTLAVVASLTVTSCGSNTNSDGELDSNRVDTSLNAGIDTSTTPVNTSMSDTTSLPKDTTGLNQ